MEAQRQVKQEPKSQAQTEPAAKFKITGKTVIIFAFCGFLFVTGALTLGLNTKAVGSKIISTVKASEGQDLEARLKSFTAGVDAGITNGFYGKEKYIDLVGLADRLQGKHYIDDVDPTNTVVKDNHGLLHFVTQQTDPTKITDKMALLNEKLKAKDIALLHVQTPLKVKEGFTELPPTITDYSNQNTDKFLQGLEEGGVNYIDLREEAEKDQLDQLSMFFHTDHHWTFNTAFWAVDKVVEKLNNDYNLGLDPDHYYRDLSNYNQNFYENVFLGSQGRRVGRFYGGVDDFNMITPKFDTQYTVQVNKSDTTEGTPRSGSFTDTIVNKSLINMEDTVYTNRYAAYFGADYREVIIKNEAVDNDKKIIVVKDSFGLPFTAFLSTMVSEVRMIDLRYFSPDNLESYIDEFDPDAVLFVYKALNTL